MYVLYRPFTLVPNTPSSLGHISRTCNLIATATSSCVSKIIQTLWSHAIYYALCFVDDHNRIPLSSMPNSDEWNGDYINACYIDVSMVART